MINRTADTVQARIDTIRMATSSELNMQDITQRFKQDMLEKSKARKVILANLDTGIRNKFPLLSAEEQ